VTDQHSIPPPDGEEFQASNDRDNLNQRLNRMRALLQHDMPINPSITQGSESSEKTTSSKPRQEWKQPKREYAPKRERPLAEEAVSLEKVQCSQQEEEMAHKSEDEEVSHNSGEEQDVVSLYEAPEYSPAEIKMRENLLSYLYERLQTRTTDDLLEMVKAHRMMEKDGM